jgi:ribosomal small subunit protein bTHX
LKVKKLKIQKEEKMQMGRGDQRSKRGKISRGTYGKTRPKANKKNKSRSE